MKDLYIKEYEVQFCINIIFRLTSIFWREIIIKDNIVIFLV